MENEGEKYNLWNEKKKELQKSSLLKTLYFKEGDIWWCSLGLNIGDESFGKGEDFRRPILILKKLSNSLCIGIPLTSKEKKGTWFVDIVLNNEIRCAMLYQIRTLHKKRFQHKLGQLNQADFIQVKEKLEALLELSLNHHLANARIEGITPQSTISISNEYIESITCYICNENEAFLAEYNDNPNFP